MKDTPRGAIPQRDKTTYAIVPRTPVGLVSPEILEAISKVVRKHQIPVTKITSGQRLALVGIKEEQVDQVWHELKMDIGPAVELCVHYVQACPGNSLCRYGVRDSIGLGMELEKMYVGLELPAKVKFGISGCPMCCGESFVRDIGVIGKQKGWTMTLGGNAGGRPRIGDVLTENLQRQDVFDLARRFLDYYRDNAKKKERTARFVERLTIVRLREILLK